MANSVLMELHDGRWQEIASQLTADRAEEYCRAHMGEAFIIKVTTDGQEVGYFCGRQQEVDAYRKRGAAAYLMAVE